MRRRLAAELDALIVKEGPDTVAAFIAEPVMGAGGVIVPPKTYFEKIMTVCAKYDVFMISDEVICGFGRLGTTFGCEKLDFAPHSISIAKMLSSAYLPIAGVMIPEEMYQALLAESKKIGVFGHGFTYGGHPVSAAVALKALEIYARDRIVEKAAAARGAIPGAAQGARRASPGRRGARARLDRRRWNSSPTRTTKRCVRAAARRRRARGAIRAKPKGLIVRAVLGDVLTLSPPLIISAAGSRRIVRPV